MNNQDRSFYVYTHTDKDGNIVYVGSGKGFRYKDKSGRQPEHLEIWQDLDKKIITSDLVEIDARKQEEHLINSIGIENLLNKAITCSSTKRRPIEYEEISKYLEINYNSPSLLSWKVEMTNGKRRVLKKVGDFAGGIAAYGYYKVQLNRRQYFVHRIVWSLHNKQDCHEDFIVDHIDGNPSNNNPDNLRLCSPRENSLNRSMNARNKSGVTGVYKKNMKGVMCWTATWQDLEMKKHRRHFSIPKYGDEIAFELACNARNSAIEKLSALGLIYSERHGK